MLFVLCPAISTPAFAGQCPPSPTPIRDLDISRYYADRAGTEIDTTKQAAKRAAVAPLKNFMTELAKGSDRVWRTSQPDTTAAACPLSWLADWAKADALLGTMASRQADYERNWALAGLAMSYVKLRPLATKEQRAAIDPWLIRLADLCRAFFDDPGRKRNNHWYWLGLGIAAAGLATNSERHWDIARAIMHDAAGDIQPNGTLPMELKRGKRALHYHNFSAQPLFSMILLAKAKGEDWSRLNDGAFHRLAGLLSQSCFRSGRLRFQSLSDAVTQERLKSNDFQQGWLQSYARSFPDKKVCVSVDENPSDNKSSNFHRLGGDLTALIRALDATYK